MARYELLLISRNFQRPRQFELNMSGRLSGEQLASLLLSAFPGQRWYCDTRPLESVGVCQSNQRLVLSDLPHAPPEHVGNGASTKLYVVHGRDAGAWVPLTHGDHILGRSAPLWLEDPLLSRSHAVLTVSARRLRLVASAGQKIFCADGSSCESLDLGIGSTFRLGNTFFAIGDPVSAESKKPVSSSELEVKVPAKPEASRLVTVVLAAFVPLLTGVLLAVLMHSMLFLIISGVSALMAVAPASQVISERRRWKQTMRAQRALAVQARSQYAAALGQSLLAGLDGAALGIAPTQLPPIVWGEGLWYPQSTEKSTPRKHRKFRLKLTRPKTDAPCHGPVFAAPLPGVWQIVAKQDAASAEVLANIVSRFLPMIYAGLLRLVIDPSICCLPASLLLITNVRISTLAEPVDRLSSVHESSELTTLYLTAKPPVALPDTLVISLGPVLSEQANHWIAPDPLTSCLPDSRFVLQRLHRLSLSRLDRLVQQFVGLRSSTNPSVLSPIQPSATGFGASIGLSEAEQEVNLDLDADGPHMLICGTTGSGKSEALRRVISDLAHQYSPERLGLVLIDFKGGAGLGVYEHLPHVQLFASDLDEAGAQRTVEQLEHEVQRREKILADSGCSDLAEFQSLDSMPQALPKLLVVIDEFRVFVETLPLAGPKIDRLAAVGRALGIHLLLSTQRPAGTLTGQTRANINTVVALRVNDPSESVELIGTTAATKLDRPGLAIIKSSSRATQSFQFHLAVEPALEGELFERDRHTMRLAPVCTFNRTKGPEDADPLRTHVSALMDRWADSPKPPSGFAPALPMPMEHLSMPSTWPGALEGSLYCGIRDNLHGGTLDPLVLGSEQKRSLLMCGLPESGAKQVLSSLSSLHRKVLCFGPSPIEDSDQTSSLRVVTGQDPYLFFDALDFLESSPKDPGLTIIIHSVAQLQSELHPQHFQRLDDALGALLRHSSEYSPLIVCSVDRDQNSLKSTGLFTTQWYFPLNATDSLKMMWPKLPACSGLPGRGVEITSGHPPQVFQITDFATDDVGHQRWDTPGPRQEDHESAHVDHSNLLGYLPFGGESALLPVQQRLIMICPNEDERLTMSQVLAHRWGAVHASGLDDIVAFADEREASIETGQDLLCACLATSADPRLAPTLEKLRRIGVRTVLFVPPSTRLTYDLGISSLSIDDRELIVVESEHSQDMQPSTWPPLHHRKDPTAGDYWRAIISRNGQPRLIHIPRAG